MNYFFLSINQYATESVQQTLLKRITNAYLLFFFILLIPLTHAADSKGIGNFEVDEEASVRALEHSLVQSGGLLLSVGKLDVETGIGFSRTENDVLLFIPTNNDGGVTGNVRNTSNQVSMPIRVRAGLPHDTQIGFSIPILYIDQLSIETVGNNAPVSNDIDDFGIGDIEVTLSKTLRREKGSKPDVIGFLSWNADNGKESDNGIFLGDGFHDFSGGLTFTKSQDPLVFSASISAQVSKEKNNIKPGNQYALSLAAFLAASPATSLRFSVDQVFIAKTTINNQDLLGSDPTIALLNVGISSVISPNTFLSFTAGAGLTDDSPRYAVNLSFSTRFDLPWNSR